MANLRSAVVALSLVSCGGATGPSDAARADSDVIANADTLAADVLAPDVFADDVPAADSGGAGDDAAVSDVEGRDRPEPERSVRVDQGEVDDAEIVDRLPIGTSSSGASRRVVLRMTPDQLPGLREGDVLMTPAEVEVTTACDVGQTGPSCGYSPMVAAQIILTGDRDDRDPSGTESQALTGVETQSVTSADHHATFTFRALPTRQVLERAFALPCVASRNCFVNLVMWAWDGAARPGDIILVGSNEGNFLENGLIGGDQARLMAIRERNLRAGDREERESTAGSGTVTMPLDASETLLGSHALRPGDGVLRAGEQYYVEARALTACSSRARFSTQIFLSRNPNARLVEQLDGISPGAIGEHNGRNCTTGTSPVTTTKVAVFRVTRDFPGPVYVQFIGRSAVPGGGASRVTVDRQDVTFRSWRYAPELQ